MDVNGFIMFVFRFEMQPAVALDGLQALIRIGVWLFTFTVCSGALNLCLNYNKYME